MIVPTLLTVILLAYGILNVPFANQMASPFIAVILIWFVWAYWRDSQKREKDSIKFEKEIDELQLQILEQKKLLYDLKKTMQDASNEKNSGDAASR